MTAPWSGSEVAAGEDELGEGVGSAEGVASTVGAALGLADRIDSEIKTGFGHGFEAPQPDPGERAETVEILDSRKEIGPADLRRDLFEAMVGIARTGKGPEEQHAAIGCSIKWKQDPSWLAQKR